MKDNFVAMKVLQATNHNLICEPETRVKTNCVDLEFNVEY